MCNATMPNGANFEGKMSQGCDTDIIVGQWKKFLGVEGGLCGYENTVPTIFSKSVYMHSLEGPCTQ